MTPLDPERTRAVLIALLQVIPTLLIAYALLELPPNRSEKQTEPLAWRPTGPRTRLIPIIGSALGGMTFCVAGALLADPGFPCLIPALAATLILTVELGLTSIRRYWPEQLNRSAEYIISVSSIVFLLTTFTASTIALLGARVSR